MRLFVRSKKGGSMTRVDKIKIGGIIFQVIREHELRHPDGRRLDGHIKYGECEIAIDDSLPYQAEMQTIWHETIHGILTHAGIDKISESLVDAIAYGVMMILYDNPQMAEVKER
jgi:hypothetical protein